MSGAGKPRRCRYCGTQVPPDAHHKRTCTTCLLAAARLAWITRSRCHPPAYLCAHGHPRVARSGERCRMCARIDRWRSEQRRVSESRRLRLGRLTDLEIQEQIDRHDRHAWNLA